MARFVQDGLDAAVAAIRTLAAKPAPALPAFHPLQPPAGRRWAHALAVDGSSAVLVDNGALWVVTYRAAAITWPGPRPLEVPVRWAAETPEGARRRVATEDSDGPSIRSAAAFADALREQAEHEAALAAIRSARQHSLVLLDGALTGLPPGPQRRADALQAAADQAGVELVGISKRSGLATNGTPWVPLLQREGPQGAWAARVEGAWVARLHARAQHAFRIDARDPGALEGLLGWCDDAVYTGYPYPLAVAHNTVAMTAAVQEDLKLRLRDGLRRAGVDAAALASDFHETLDRNVPG